MEIGWVGLGSLGGPMAFMAMHSGLSLSIYARRPETLVPFRDTPAVVVPTLRELGQRSDVVLVMVREDEQVEDVVLGDNLLAGMRPGSIIAVSTTSHPDTCRRLAAAAAERGVTLLDAPISGGTRLIALAAELGFKLPNSNPVTESGFGRRMAVMVGGDSEAFDRCLPLFESFGELVRLIGPLAAGRRPSCSTTPSSPPISCWRMTR